MTVSGIQSIGLTSTRATATVSSSPGGETGPVNAGSQGSHISSSYRSSLMLHSAGSSMATGGLERAVGMALALKILEMLLGQGEDDQDSSMQDMMMLGMLDQLGGGRRSAGMSLLFEREASSSHTFTSPAVTASYMSTSASMTATSVDVSA